MSKTPMEHGSRSGPEESRLQGHWLLAKMGKKVLRPGGIELTRKILAEAKPAAKDRIVEFGPGVGRTAELLLVVNPASYTGVDPNPEGRKQLAEVLAGHDNATCVVADARETGLPDASADLVVGEAMLTMMSAEGKKTIIEEAARVLAPGGRYAVHELSLIPDGMSEAEESAINKSLSRSIKVGARPLTESGWTKLFTEAGLEVTWVGAAPMRLLEPSRLIADEGVFGFLKFASNVARNKAARKRILGMRKVFRQNKEHIGAIGLVAQKPKS